MASVQTVLAPAKINLRLRVLAREETGFHQLETLFCALGFADRLEIQDGDGLRLSVTGADVGPPEGNLVFRAARAFFRETGIDEAASIRLHKTIPAGAGLGGGSSDAASCLLALNQRFDRPLAPGTLLRIAADLGSDVPFFLVDSPIALAWNRGDRLLPLPPPPAAPVLLVIPDFPISTPAAYRDLAIHRAATGAPDAGPLVLDRRAFDSWTDLAALAVNDFEPPTFARFPELARIRDTLCDEEAILALLSGSGSALFGIFADRDRRDLAADRIRQRFPRLRLIPTETRTAGDTRSFG